MVLLKLAESGIEAVASMPERVRETEDKLLAVGGRLEAWVQTTGEFDAVALVDLSTDEAAAKKVIEESVPAGAQATILRALTGFAWTARSVGHGPGTRSRRPRI